MEQEIVTPEEERQFLEEPVTPGIDEDIHANVMNEEEIDHRVVEINEDGTVIEEVVTTEQVYNDNGELVTYVYQGEDGNEIVEEEYIDLGGVNEGSQYSYMIEENGVTRLLHPDEIQELRNVSESTDMKSMTGQGGMQSRIGVDQKSSSRNAPAKVRLKKPKHNLNAESSSSSNGPNIYKPRPRKPREPIIPYEAEDDEILVNDLENSLPTYLREKLVYCLSKTANNVSKKRRTKPTLRDLVQKELAGQGTSNDTIEEVVYMGNEQFYDEHGQLIQVTDSLEEKVYPESHISEKASAELNEIARIEIEKQLSTKPCRRGLLDEYHDDENVKTIVPFSNTTKPIKRKLVNPVNHNNPVREVSSMANFSKPPMPIRGVDKDYMNTRLLKDTNDNAPIRFKCPECEEGFSAIEKLCIHLSSVHEEPTEVRQVDCFSEREFESFMNKIEREGCSSAELAIRVEKIKTRPGASQFFKCNFWSKLRTESYPEMIEIHVNELDEAEETCPAFILKLNNFDCIRLKFCDHHMHGDDATGSRLPIPVKRKIYELSFKRLPADVISSLIQEEIIEYAAPGSRTEQRLKALTGEEVSQILENLRASRKRYIQGKLMLSKSDNREKKNNGEVQELKEETDDIVKGEVEEEPTPTLEDTQKKNEPSTSGLNDSKNLEAPVLEREESVPQEHIVFDDDALNERRAYLYEKGILNVDPIYDPVKNKDALIEELDTNELRLLEQYEQTHGIVLNEDQKRERLRLRMKFLLVTINENFLLLDGLTHGLSSNDHRINTIQQVRHMATKVLEIACDFEAEIRANYRITSSFELIKQDLLASVSCKEKRYNVSEKVGFGRRKPVPIIERTSEDEITEDIFNRVQAMENRRVGINPSGSFTLEKSGMPVQHVDYGDYGDKPEILDNRLIKGRIWNPPKGRKKRNSGTAQEKLPPKKRGRTTRDEYGEEEEEEEKQLPANMEDLMDNIMAESINITTNDNVPHAIAMGVDHVVEISTEGDVQHDGEFVANQDERISEEMEVIEQVEIVEEEKKMTLEEALIESARKELKSDEVVHDPITVTRTGRVVKQKKWQD